MSGVDGGHRYQQGPKPHDFDGQRSLDFVLDNDTLQDFNRTLLIDIKLLNVRSAKWQNVPHHVRLFSCSPFAPSMANRMPVDLLPIRVSESSGSRVWAGSEESTWENAHGVSKTGCIHFLEEFRRIGSGENYRTTKCV